jgi:hypothetical protein
MNTARVPEYDARSDCLIEMVFEMKVPKREGQLQQQSLSQLKFRISEFFVYHYLLL